MAADSVERLAVERLSAAMHSLLRRADVTADVEVEHIKLLLPKGTFSAALAVLREFGATNGRRTMSAPNEKEARPELCPICIARARHGPPLAAQIRFLTRERDAAIAETLRMQTLIDELRDEAARWRDERNELAAQWRACDELEHERDLLRDVALRLWNEVEYPAEHRDLAVDLGFTLSLTGDRELNASRPAEQPTEEGEANG